MTNHPSDLPAAPTGDPAAWRALDVAVAQLALDLIRAERLPAAAAATLEAGAAGEALGTLAGLADTAGSSEIHDLLARIYAAERGGARPAGRAAGELVAADLLERGADPESDGLAVIGDAYELWVLAEFPDGDLADVGVYAERLEMAAEGVLDGGAEAVVAEFRTECARLLAAGGPVIEGWPRKLG